MTDKAIEVMNDILNVNNNNKISTNQTNNLTNKINEYNARDGSGIKTNSDNNLNEHVIIFNPFTGKINVYICQHSCILCISTYFLFNIYIFFYQTENLVHNL